jgi:hypothetical protein
MSTAFTSSVPSSICFTSLLLDRALFRENGRVGRPSFARRAFIRLRRSCVFFGAPFRFIRSTGCSASRCVRIEERVEEAEIEAEILEDEGAVPEDEGRKLEEEGAEVAGSVAVVADDATRVRRNWRFKEMGLASQLESPILILSRCPEYFLYLALKSYRNFLKKLRT